MERNSRFAVSSVTTLIAAAGLSTTATAAVIDFQMNDANGTELEGLVNTGTSSGAGVNFNNGPANVATDGNGFLVLVDGNVSPNNANNAFVPTDPPLGITTGIYELEFEYGASAIDAGFGAPEVGFEMWSSGAASLFRVGLDKDGGDLKLALNIGGNITFLDRFGTDQTPVTSFTEPLNVRAVVDLDTDNLDIFWSGALNGSSLGNTASDLTLNGIRIAANLAFLGATDEVKVDFVTLSLVPEPASLALVGLGLVAVMRRGGGRRD